MIILDVPSVDQVLFKYFKQRKSNLYLSVGQKYTKCTWTY